MPCVSTFAVMLKTIGRRDAVFSVGLSVAVALGIAADVPDRPAGRQSAVLTPVSPAGAGARGIRPAWRRCAERRFAVLQPGGRVAAARAPAWRRSRLAHDARVMTTTVSVLVPASSQRENAAPTTGISPSTGMPERL